MLHVERIVPQGCQTRAKEDFYCPGGYSSVGYINILITFFRTRIDDHKVCLPFILTEVSDYILVRGNALVTSSPQRRVRIAQVNQVFHVRAQFLVPT